MLLGLDDTGRGSLAGPMIFCALVVRKEDELKALGAKDSKQTTKDSRMKFAKNLFEHPDFVSCSYSMAGPNMIKELGFTYSEWSKVAELIQTYLLRYPDLCMKIDGKSETKLLPPDVQEKIEYIPKADASEPVVSAASMLAKLKHDGWVATMIARHPGWGFEHHNGYPTREHVLQLIDKQPIPGVHRIKPCMTAVASYCKKQGLELPEWYRNEQRRISGALPKA